VLVHVKLDQDYGDRPETNRVDFELPAEVCSLIGRTDQTSQGRLARLEVRAGLPWRIVIEASMRENVSC
jgi:hypothetical protein